MTEDPPPFRRQRLLPLIALFVAALAGAWLLRDTLSYEALRDNRAGLIAFRDANYLLAVMGFMAIYVVIVALSLPGATVATLTGGFLFGIFPGAVYCVLAAGTGACLIFLAARAGLGDWLSRRMATSDGAAQRIKEGIDQNEWSVLFLMRLLPAVPFFLANLLPALFGARFLPYVVTTYLGIVPGAVVLTSVGAGLGQVFASGEAPDLSVLTSPQFLVPVLGLAALVALPLAVWLWRAR